MTGPALRLLAAAACAAATLLLPATAAIADWHQSVGGARPVNTAARNARSPNLQAIGGVPYVAWNEDTSVQGQGSSSTIHVSRLAADGQSWAGVAEGGPNPISLRTSSSSDNPWLADVGGTPWVAWDEGVTQTDKEIRVSRLNASGDAWQEVPSPPSAQPINVNADGNANRPTLVDGGGRPYVSFYELDPGSGSLVGPAFFGLPNRAPSQVWVRRANAAGTGWDTVGGGPVSPDASKDAVFPRMTLVDGVPWAVWWQVDVVNNTPQATVEVSHLNDAGTAWVQMPPITTSVFGNQGPGISFPAIATVGDVPYIAYSDNGGSGNKRMRVYRLNDAATGFDPVGGPVSDGSAGADNPSIASIGGTPWVAWSEQGNSGGQLTRAARLVGGDWQQAGTTANADPAHAARYAPSLASVGGFPWVAFAENDNSAPGSPGCCVQTRVSRLEPTFTSTNAQSSDTTATLVAKVQTFGLPYPVGFHYGEGTSLGQATAPSAASGPGLRGAEHLRPDPADGVLLRALRHRGNAAAARRGPRRRPRDAGGVQPGGRRCERGRRRGGGTGGARRRRPALRRDHPPARPRPPRPRGRRRLPRERRCDRRGAHLACRAPRCDAPPPGRGRDGHPALERPPPPGPRRRAGCTACSSS
ncbi:MAG: hypothetical protein ACXVSX_08350 [Solirubrobacteraceae bacterium]